jgi:hypothetical protein
LTSIPIGSINIETGENRSMKRVAAIIACLAIAACSKAPDTADVGPDVTGNAVSAIAFSYTYDLTLPTGDIAGLQERHAAACEKLGTDRCRITGLHYTVYSSGEVAADLSMALAAPIARAFGREGVVAAERIGATLSGASIGGSEAATLAGEDELAAGDAATDRAELDRELQRPGLTAAARTELLQRRAALVAQTRAARRDAAATRASIVTAPMTFTYHTGRGTGLFDRLRDAGDAAAASALVTVMTLLTIVATLGPPAIVLLLLFLVWRRWFRPVWRRIADRTRPAEHPQP